MSSLIFLRYRLTINQVIIDGPLLQAASTVTKATKPFDVHLELTLPPELPKGFCGHPVRPHELRWVGTADWQGMLSDILSNAPIPLKANGCPDTV